MPAVVVEPLADVVMPAIAVEPLDDVLPEAPAGDCSSASPPQAGNVDTEAYRVVTQMAFEKLKTERIVIPLAGS